MYKCDRRPGDILSLAKSNGGPGRPKGWGADYATTRGSGPYGSPSILTVGRASFSSSLAYQSALAIHYGFPSHPRCGPARRMHVLGMMIAGADRSSGAGRSQPASDEAVPDHLPLDSVRPDRSVVK